MKCEKIIEPRNKKFNLIEIIFYRDLLFFLVLRDVGVRYRQSLIGIGWAMIQPILTMIVFTIIFGNFAKIPSDGIPYPIFSYCALLPWTYFSRSLTAASDSLVGAKNLISKVYFPRLILPVCGVLVGIIDFLFAFIVLIVMMIWYGISININIVFLPILIVLSMFTALGAGLWLSSLNVLYRDVKFVVPFFLQVWMYGSPIIYSSNLIPDKWLPIYGLNPMVVVIEGFRWALLNKQFPDLFLIVNSSIVVIALLISGIIFFKKMEVYFADVI